jgi:hypothetical protein
MNMTPIRFDESRPPYATTLLRAVKRERVSAAVPALKGALALVAESAASLVA